MMNMEATPGSGDLTSFEQLRYGREVIRTEAEALATLANRLDSRFCDAIQLLSQCAGNVIVTGMGKAGLVGQKIAATLASTGTSSHFLHPGEAVHGDLGRIQSNDLVLSLSASGETEEVVRLLPLLRDFGTPLVAITGDPNNTLARHSLVALTLGPIREACALGLAPSTSTTAMLALGDALALVVSRVRQFRREDFARFHPGGALGRKLAKVVELMRPLAECRMASHTESVRAVLIGASRPGRRPGAIMLVDDQGSLRGVFTDSDLARLLESNEESVLDCVIGDVMTVAPKTVSVDALLEDAVAILAHCKISELPVVNQLGQPQGMIDITDLVGLVPGDSQLTRSCDGETSASSPDPNTIRFQISSHPKSA